MPIFDDDDIPFPVWTQHDVDLLEAIDPFLLYGLTNVVEYLVTRNGLVDNEKFDLLLLMHAVANKDSREDMYSLDETEAVIGVASEFCLVDCLYDRQSLEALELQDNGVLFLAVNESNGAALDAAVCLSARSSSMFRYDAVRPSLALFGEWETISGEILKALLTMGQTSTKIGFLVEYLKASKNIPLDDLLLIGILLKLAEVGLFNIYLDNESDGVLSINTQAAGIFLLFSNREELARRLAELTE